MKTKEEMLRMLGILVDESLPYQKRLEAYEYLLEDCDEIVDDMLEKFYAADGETGKMLIEILAGYKGNPAIYMGLVSYLYKGEDVALFARLLGSYGDERAVDLLKGFAEEYELNYNEYMEVRNAVEQLGGYFDDTTQRTIRTILSTAISKAWTNPKRTAAVPPSRIFLQNVPNQMTRTITTIAKTTIATVTTTNVIAAVTAIIDFQHLPLTRRRKRKPVKRT